MDSINETACTCFKLTEPNKDNSNPTSYGMFVPIMSTSCNNDANDKLTDKHALNEFSTPNIGNVTISVCTYLHCLQELKVYDQPCPATLSQGL